MPSFKHPDKVSIVIKSVMTISWDYWYWWCCLSRLHVFWIWVRADRQRDTHNAFYFSKQTINWYIPTVKWAWNEKWQIQCWGTHNVSIALEAHVMDYEVLIHMIIWIYLNVFSRHWWWIILQKSTKSHYNSGYDPAAALSKSD